MKVLLVVDVQNDFLPGGSLAVPGGDKIIPVIQKLLARFKGDNAVPKIFTQDYHPAQHVSFASMHEGEEPFTMSKLLENPRMLWPDHCVQDTDGCEFADELYIPGCPVITKGMDKQADSYSGFVDDNGVETQMLHVLDEHGGYNDASRGETRLYICGLATDVCVKATALDAIKYGFSATVVSDACAGVSPEATVDAIGEMLSAGIAIMHSQYVK